MDNYLNQPCDRCGSKRKIGKKWKEKVPTMTGTTLVEYSQIICTNKLCQEAFDKSLIVEAKKKVEQKEKKEKQLIENRKAADKRVKKLSKKVKKSPAKKTKKTQKKASRKKSKR